MESTRHAEDDALVRAAAEMLEKKRAKRRIKSLRLWLELEEEERELDARLKAQEDLLARMKNDARLAALLARRRRGEAPQDAIRAVERRFGRGS
jgi:hypothetical protein